MDVRQVLVSDQCQGYCGNIQFCALDQLQEQIEWPLINGSRDGVTARLVGELGLLQVWIHGILGLYHPHIWGITSQHYRDIIPYLKDNIPAVSGLYPHMWRIASRLSQVNILF